jgi:hypothetical protein
MKTFYQKIIPLVVTGCLFSTSVFAQDFYFTAGGGYGFGMSTQNLPGFYNSRSNNDSATYEQINISLGKGLNFGASFGYMFREYLGAEIGISYLLGSKTQVKDITDYGESVYSYSASMLRLVPSIVVSAGLDKVNPYAKFGLIIGIGSVSNDLTNDEDSSFVEKNYVMNGGVAFGCSAAAGVLVKLNKHFSFFGEINLVNLSYAPTKGELIHATYNNNDMLPGMSVKEKETEYVNNYTYNYQTPSPEDQPNKELKNRLPFGSIGINVGVQFRY